MPTGWISVVLHGLACVAHGRLCFSVLSPLRPSLFCCYNAVMFTLDWKCMDGRDAASSVLRFSQFCAICRTHGTCSALIWIISVILRVNIRMEGYIAVFSLQRSQTRGPFAAKTPWTNRLNFNLIYLLSIQFIQNKRFTLPTYFWYSLLHALHCILTHIYRET